jgi:hypothetical protein
MTEPRWWELRPAQNLDAKTYRCPLCGAFLPSASEHVLLMPEGDRSQRRHAHSECVAAARREGRLPSREEWRSAQPRRRWRERLFGRGKRETQERD